MPRITQGGQAQGFEIGAGGINLASREHLRPKDQIFLRQVIRTQVPNPRMTIAAPGYDTLAVRAESHGHDRFRMQRRRCHRFTGGNVPNSGLIGGAGRRDELAIRAEGYLSYLPEVAQERS